MHLGKNGADHQDVAIIQHGPTDSSLFASEAEVSVKAGAKRTRGLGSEDDYGSTSDADKVFCVDAVSTVVTRAKKLRISDSAADARDAELSQCLTVKKKHEGEAPSLQNKAIQYFIIPVKPSLPGLPEELIVEILQGLAISDIMAIRRVRSNKNIGNFLVIS